MGGPGVCDEKGLETRGSPVLGGPTGRSRYAAGSYPTGKLPTSGRKMARRLITSLNQMRLRPFLSLGSAAVVAVVCLLSVPAATQKTSKGSVEAAGQTQSEVGNGSGDRQSRNPRSDNPATDGRVNVTVTPQHEEKGEGGSPKGLGWITWFISVVFSWPFLVAALAVYVLCRPRRVQSILLNFQSFKFFGAEFILDRRSGSTAEAAIQVYRDAVKDKFDAIAQGEQIADKHKRIVDKLLEKTSGILKGVALRSTIYVPDMLFDESLYQLLDYYPTTSDGGKKGRVFSARYGMIGRCWRSEKSVVQGKVPTNEGELINVWGMGKREASEAALGRQSFACVILKNADNVPLGLFYMDSSPELAFDSTWDQLEPFIGERQNPMD